MNYIMKVKILNGVTCLAMLIMLDSCNDSMPAYKNPQKSVEVRVADLLDRMTLEEKVAQM